VENASPVRREPIERDVWLADLERRAASGAVATPNRKAALVDADALVDLTAKDTFCYHRPRFLSFITECI